MKYKLRILQLPESLKQAFGPGVQWALEEIFHDNLVALIDFQNCKREVGVLIGSPAADVIEAILPAWVRAEWNPEAHAEFMVEMYDKEGQLCETHGIKHACPRCLGQALEDGSYRFTLSYELR